MVVKMSSAYYVCCKISNAIKTVFMMEAKTMMISGQHSDLGPYCLHYTSLLKYISK